jgi:hypothetical protein
MNLTNHCKERYVERIKGIVGPEVRPYITLNDERISEHILKLHEHSIFLYKGQLGGDKVTKIFRINGDIVLVMDTAESCIISMYKVDFGFPEHTNRAVIKDLISELVELNTRIDTEAIAYEGVKESKQARVDDLTLEIKNLREQIEILEARKKIAQSEIEDGMLSIHTLRKQAEHYATMLCNSLDFKRDIKSST